MGWGSKRDANGDRTHDGLGQPLDEEGKKFFRIRESGYTGWLDQNSNHGEDFARRAREATQKALDDKRKGR